MTLAPHPRVFLCVFALVPGLCCYQMFTVRCGIGAPFGLKLIFCFGDFDAV